MILSWSMNNLIGAYIMMKIQISPYIRRFLLLFAAIISLNVSAQEVVEDTIVVDTTVVQQVVTLQDTLITTDTLSISDTIMVDTTMVDVVTIAEVSDTIVEVPDTIKTDTLVVKQLPRELTRAEKINLRGVTNLSNVFIPKGQWIVGLSASYSTHTNKNYTFLVIEGIDSEGYSFKFSPMVAYAFRNNMSAGFRGAYTRTNLTVDGADLKIGDEETGTEINITDFKAVKHSYTVSAIWCQYIPLGQSKQFAFSNEISLGFTGSQAIFAADQPVRGTYETGYKLSVGVSPGLIAFATDNVAVEVNVGISGLNYSSVKQVHNQVSTGRRRSSSMNFNINLFSIGMGVSIYL